MPSYKKYLIAASLLFSLTGCSNEVVNLNAQTATIQEKYFQVKTKKFLPENQYIMFALEYEYQRYFQNARELYLKLFEETNKYEYLLKYLALSFQLSDFKKVISTIDKYYIENIKQEEELLRLYSLSLFKLKKFDESIVWAKKLLSKFETDTNLELLGTFYLQSKDFTKALDYFKRAFALNNSANTLLTLTNIQYYYTSDKDNSKESLENYISQNGYIYNLCIQLLSFYEQEKDRTKILDLLNKMYENYKYKNNKEILERTRGLLVRYISQKNLNEAIIFLETENIKDNLLLALYRTVNDTKKAYELLNYLYSKTNNLDYLAQIAILEFELASDKKIVIPEVIAKFDKALGGGVNKAMYQNYLAYLLIDYNIDIKRGLDLVAKALKQEPKNLAYLDTLAWGEYKSKNCKKAYDLMKDIVHEAGLEDNEIKQHWDKIKECTK